ncbi:MAG TPA: hypothetical protein VJ546_09610 [Bacillales bacterium]|nr:hypothetical protein [Bacillales bacterium]
MLKIVHPICCGIDVHKKFVVATVGTTNKSGVTEYQTKQFSTFTEDSASSRVAEIPILQTCLYGIYREVLAPCV